MLGTSFLVVTADRLPRGWMLIAVFGSFGALIVVLGNSTMFWLSRHKSRDVRRRPARSDVGGRAVEA
jgi:hypothetical protein